MVICTAWERLTFAEAKATQDQLKNDPEFNPEFNQLLDLTAVTVLDISTDEARMIARLVFFSPTARRAFVATSPSIFGMGRLMGTHDEMARYAEQVGIFHDRVTALKWLGLDALPR